MVDQSDDDDDAELDDEPALSDPEDAPLAALSGFRVSFT